MITLINLVKLQNDFLPLYKIVQKGLFELADDVLFIISRYGR